MALNELTIKSLKPKLKVYRVADAGGLTLEITPSGSKLWRWRYYFNSKAQMLVYAILDMPAQQNADGESILQVICLSSEALEEWRAFAKHIETSMRPNALFEHATDWAGKAPGAKSSLITAETFSTCSEFPVRCYHHRIGFSDQRQCVEHQSYFE